jgi:hypothetical protein
MVNIKIYDMLGRQVAELVNEQKDPGGYEINFDASRYASGVSIYQLVVSMGNNIANASILRQTQDKQGLASDKFVSQKKMVLLG